MYRPAKEQRCCRSTSPLTKVQGEDSKPRILDTSLIYRGTSIVEGILSLLNHHDRRFPQSALRGGGGLAYAGHLQSFPAFGISRLRRQQIFEHS